MATLVCIRFYQYQLLICPTFGMGFLTGEHFVAQCRLGTTRFSKYHNIFLFRVISLLNIYQST